MNARMTSEQVADALMMADLAKGAAEGGSAPLGL
jgi:hypothetical protein